MKVILAVPPPGADGFLISTIMATHKSTFAKVDFLFLHHLCDAAYLLQEIEDRFTIMPRDMAIISFLARTDTRARTENIKRELLKPVRTGTDLRDEMARMIRRGFVEEVREQPGQPKTMRSWRLTPKGFDLVEKINKFAMELQAERIK